MFVSVFVFCCVSCAILWSCLTTKSCTKVLCACAVRLVFVMDEAGTAGQSAAPTRPGERSQRAGATMAGPSGAAVAGTAERGRATDAVLLPADTLPGAEAVAGTSPARPAVAARGRARLAAPASTGGRFWRSPSKRRYVAAEDGTDGSWNSDSEDGSKRKSRSRGPSEKYSRMVTRASSTARGRGRARVRRSAGEVKGPGRAKLKLCTEREVAELTARYRRRSSPSASVALSPAASATLSPTLSPALLQQRARMSQPRRP